MTESTKEKALEKLDQFTVKIGYPDKFEDYFNLDLSEDSSYIENVQIASKFNRDIMLERLYKEPDRKKWWMSPQTVIAYYNPTQNEIVFPAGILQYPFFDMEMSSAENYGGIGGVIGHEITHGKPEPKDGFTPEQQFFLSWARIWRSVARPEYEEQMRTSDPHSPPKARVNVTLANIPEFHEHFTIKEGDQMFRANLVELW